MALRPKEGAAARALSREASIWLAGLASPAPPVGNGTTIGRGVVAGEAQPRRQQGHNEPTRLVARAARTRLLVLFGRRGPA